MTLLNTKVISKKKGCKQRPPDSAKRSIRKIIQTYTIIFTVFLLLQPVAGLHAFASEIVNTGIFAALWLIARHRIEEDTATALPHGPNISHKNFVRHGIHGQTLLQDTWVFIFVSLVVLVPFYFGYVFFFKYLCSSSLSIAMSYRETFFSAICRQFIRRKWRYRWPAKLYPKYFETILSQFLVVAFPEEYFFRGYMQTGFKRYIQTGSVEKEQQPKRTFFSLLFSKYNLLTSVFFSIGHLIARFSPMRLFVFFPSLVFGALRDFSGSIWPGVFFHATANVFSDMLHRGYLND